MMKNKLICKSKIINSILVTAMIFNFVVPFSGTNISHASEYQKYTQYDTDEKEYRYSLRHYYYENLVEKGDTIGIKDANGKEYAYGFKPRESMKYKEMVSKYSTATVGMNHNLTNISTEAISKHKDKRLNVFSGDEGIVFAGTMFNNVPRDQMKDIKVDYFTLPKTEPSGAGARQLSEQDLQNLLKSAGKRNGLWHGQQDMHSLSGLDSGDSSTWTFGYSNTSAFDWATTKIDFNDSIKKIRQLNSDGTVGDYKEGQGIDNLFTQINFNFKNYSYGSSIKDFRHGDIHIGKPLNLYKDLEENYPLDKMCNNKVFSKILEQPGGILDQMREKLMDSVDDNGNLLFSRDELKKLNTCEAFTNYTKRIAQNDKTGVATDRLVDTIKEVFNPNTPCSEKTLGGKSASCLKNQFNQIKAIPSKKGQKSLAELLGMPKDTPPSAIPKERIRDLLQLQNLENQWKLDSNKTTTYFRGIFLPKDKGGQDLSDWRGLQASIPKILEERQKNLASAKSKLDTLVGEAPNQKTVRQIAKEDLFKRKKEISDFLKTYNSNSDTDGRQIFNFVSELGLDNYNGSGLSKDNLYSNLHDNLLKNIGSGLDEKSNFKLNEEGAKIAGRLLLGKRLIEALPDTAPTNESSAKSPIFTGSTKSTDGSRGFYAQGRTINGKNYVPFHTTFKVEYYMENGVEKARLAKPKQLALMSEAELDYIRNLMESNNVVKDDYDGKDDSFPIAGPDMDLNGKKLNIKRSYAYYEVDDKGDVKNPKPNIGGYGDLSPENYEKHSGSKEQKMINNDLKLRLLAALREIANMSDKTFEGMVDQKLPEQFIGQILENGKLKEQQLLDLKLKPEDLYGHYRLSIPIIVRLSWNPGLDLKATKIHADVDVNNPSAKPEIKNKKKAKVNITAYGGLNKGRLKNDIFTKTTTTIEAHTKDGCDPDFKFDKKVIQGVNDTSIASSVTSNTNKQFVTKDYRSLKDGGLTVKNGISHTATTQLEVVRGNKDRCLKVRYMINSNGTTDSPDASTFGELPKGENTYDNNIVEKIIRIPRLEDPDLIAKPPTPKELPPDPKTPGQPWTGRFCAQGDGFSTGLAEDVWTKHKLYLVRENGTTINLKAPSGGTFEVAQTTGKINLIANGQTYHLGNSCENITIPPGETMMKLCYEVNYDEMGNRMAHYKTGKPEDFTEVDYKNNISCVDIPVPNVPHTPPPVPPRTPSIPIGCGGLVQGYVNRSNNREYNYQTSRAGSVAIPSKTNLHAAAKVVGIADDHVYKMSEFAYDPASWPQSYVWYNTLQQDYRNRKSHYYTPDKYRAGLGVDYTYSIRPNSPYTHLKVEVISTRGRGGCRTKGGCVDWKRGVSTGVGGTELVAGCLTEAQEQCYEMETWYDSDGKKHETCTKESGFATVCINRERVVAYGANAALEYAAIVRNTNLGISPFDNFAKLAPRNMIKSGYGIKVNGAYEFETDWDGQIRQNPFMIRPEKERRLYEISANYPQYTDILDGRDGIGIKGGTINGAYLGRTNIDGRVNTAYEQKGYNRKVNLQSSIDTSMVLNGTSHSLWKAEYNRSAGDQYSGSKKPNHVTKSGITMFSDVNRMKQQGISGIYQYGGGGANLGKDDWSPDNVYAGSTAPKHIIYLKYPDGPYEIEGWGGIVLERGGNAYFEDYDCTNASIEVKGNAWEDSYVNPSDEGRGRDERGNQLGTDKSTGPWTKDEKTFKK